jgi:hypothetical protein
MGGQGPRLDETAGPFGEPALYFNGSAYLSIPYHSYFDLFNQLSSFTIELWFKIDRTSALSGSVSKSGTLIAFGWPNSGAFTNGVSIRVSGTSQSGTGLEIEYQTATSTWLYEWITPIDKDVWHHVAFCKENSTGLMTAYLDGNRLRSQEILQNAVVTSFPTTLPVKIGADNYTSWLRNFIGWMANIRITKECRYFGDFVLPTTDFDSGDPYIADTAVLLPFNETTKNPLYGLTNDIKAHTITLTGDVSLSANGMFGGTCGYWDGTAGGDRLAVTYNSDYDVSTGAFTLEFWYNPQSITSAQVIVDWRSSYTALRS